MTAIKVIDHNIVFVTLDSCRYDTYHMANTPFLDSIGGMKPAWTHGTYTVPAHTAFFAGHFPVVLQPSLRAPYLTESLGRLWRIQTGRANEEESNDLLLEGKDIIAGFRHLDYYVLGIGGVTQFNVGSQLRSYPWNDFLYYGPDLDEEPIRERNQDMFPLSHHIAICNRLKPHQRWFAFINCPETHYPYDIGKGFKKEVKQYLPLLKNNLNLREPDSCIPDNISNLLHQMQIEALEFVDEQLRVLFKELQKISDRPLLSIICGDHGESFGETFSGRRRWGHLFPSEEVLKVPLLITSLS